MPRLEPETTIPKDSSPARNSWRQGSVVPHETAVALSLFAPNDGSCVAVVVTHDCDCVQSQAEEPYLEIVVGRIIAAADPNLTNAKSVKTLHLPVGYRNDTLTIELVANPKCAVLKDALQGSAPDAEYLMSDSVRRTLSLWLKARYYRASFPDELVKRLKLARHALEDVAKSNPYAIHGIYIGHDPNEELASDERYLIDVFVVFNTEIEGADQVARAAAAKLRRRFELKFKTVETENIGVLWESIELNSCEAISDIDFTMADLLSFQQYRLDYVSMRETPQGDLPDIT